MYHPATPPRPRPPFVLVLMFTALNLLLGATAVRAAVPDAPQAQRAAFRKALAAAQQGGEGWHAWDRQLAGYPLYPYLEAAALSHDLDALPRARVEEFLRRYPDSIPAQDLRRDFLLQAAGKQRWDDFLALYQPGLGDTLSCDALQARLAKGGTLQFQRDLAALWEKPSLPSACDPILEQAGRQGLLTRQRLWQRIDRAVDAGRGGTVASLAGQLPSGERDLAEHLAKALRDPSGATHAAIHWPDVPRNRQAAAIALRQLARHDSDRAETAWKRLRRHFSFSATERTGVEYALALYHATDFDQHALARLAALPEAARTDTSREWRARVALARQDWKAVLDAIMAMPAEQRDDDEWRYFHARALAASGHAEEAQALFKALAREPTYFGFLAADRIGADYSLCPLQPAPDAERKRALASNPGLQRAFELYAVDLPQPARREWARALDGSDTATRQAAADVAYQRGWYDRAVFTFSSGKALRYYSQRFPLASQDGVVPQAVEAGIDPAWAYAIARAESAWMTDAHSGADARGLMQLLPSTAARVAHRNGLAWAGGESLYDPVVNIALGTRYLAQMAERFNGAPWLASAAYNAGPSRVDQWVAERGTLAPDLFVATIPFHETREYVARVMAFAVIYDWRLGGGVVPISSRMPGVGLRYAPPDAGTVRKQVRCVDDDPAPARAGSRHGPAKAASGRAATGS